MTTPSTKAIDIPMEVPSFLRKTYHMVDSCNPEIAGWSEDGTTFVVKNPTKFERDIIPQFFKHNKFSSFVRQLNFYSFRKIKYVDSIRLDPKLEAETANYWRFHHEHFQRGKPEGLKDIKRMTASSNNSNSQNKAANTATPPNASSSSSSPEASQAMKSEIDTLKKKLEEMNKNMTQLTTMVQKVTLEDGQKKQVETSMEGVPGAKRKKVDFKDDGEAVVPEAAVSLADLPSNLDDLILSSDSNALMELEALPVPSAPLKAASREASMASSSSTDQDFVDQLFTAFGDETSDDFFLTTDNNEANSNDDALPDPSSVNYTYNNNNHSSSYHNRPDPELMERLSEALAVLPKEMQDQIVNRLIASIVSADLFGSSSSSSSTSPPNVVPSGKSLPMEDDHDEDNMSEDTSPAVEGMPLAAATLASLLSYYSHLVKDTESREKIVKNIPVIPCHA